MFEKTRLLHSLFLSVKCCFVVCFGLLVFLGVSSKGKAFHGTVYGFGFGDVLLFAWFSGGRKPAANSSKTAAGRATHQGDLFLVFWGLGRVGPILLSGVFAGCFQRFFFFFFWGGLFLFNRNIRFLCFFNETCFCLFF